MSRRIQSREEFLLEEVKRLSEELQKQKELSAAYIKGQFSLRQRLQEKEEEIKQIKAEAHAFNRETERVASIRVANALQDSRLMRAALHKPPLSEEFYLPLQTICKNYYESKA